MKPKTFRTIFTALSIVLITVLLTSMIRFAQPVTTIREIAEMARGLRKNRNDTQSPILDVLVQTNPQLESELDVVYAGETGHRSPYGFWDASIIRRHTDGRQEVIIESVKEALPATRERENISIQRIAALSPSLLIVKTALMETDNPGGSLYRFDASTRSFSKMKLNEIYRRWGEGMMSPDGTLLAWAPNDWKEGAQTLYLLDLRNDSYRTLVTLPANETIVIGFALDSQTDISWTNHDTIRYSVYDKETKELKEFRTVAIR